MLAVLQMWFLNLLWEVAKRLLIRLGRNVKVDFVCELVGVGIAYLKGLGLSQAAITSIVQAAYDGRLDNINIFLSAVKATLPPSTQPEGGQPTPDTEKSPAPGLPPSPVPDRPNLPGPSGSVPPAAPGVTPGGAQ